MKLSEFKRHLAAHPEHELCFVLADGGRIEAHAHITEVGRTDRRFIDCGGTIRHTAACTLQAWVADDTEHRLLPGRLASILDKAEPLLGNDDLDVEVEYEDCNLSQFPISSVQTGDGVLAFHLTEKKTDCLAKEVCIPSTGNTGESCCAGTGCC
jgi:hypothetical protein